jgi:hypothetical protein
VKHAARATRLRSAGKTFCVGLFARIAEALFSDLRLILNHLPAMSSGAARRVEVGEGWRHQGSIFHKFECSFDDGVLALRIAWRIERIAVAERHKQGARWADALNHFTKQLDHHGRNPLPL